MKKVMVIVGVFLYVTLFVGMKVLLDTNIHADMALGLNIVTVEDSAGVCVPVYVMFAQVVLGIVGLIVLAVSRLVRKNSAVCK